MSSKNFDYTINYRPQVTPRTVLIRQTGQNVTNKYLAMYADNQADIIAKPIQLQKSKNPEVMKETESREKDKKSMCKLNDKFASLIERVRYLEIQNKKLTMELEPLLNLENQKAGAIKNMYDSEIKELKELTYQVFKEKHTAESKDTQIKQRASKLKAQVTDSEKILEENRVKIEQMVKKISINDGEISLLKRRLENAETITSRYKSEVQYTINEIQRFTMELDRETSNRLKLENEKTGLDEELYYLNQNHEQELENSRNKIFKDVGMDANTFFKSELSKYITQLRDDYEKSSAKQHAIMENWYLLKVQEIQRPKYKNEEIDGLNTLNKTMKKSLEEQNLENAKLKAMQAETIAKIKYLEDTLYNEKYEGNELIDEKNTELELLDRQYKDIMADYKAMLKTKISLESEISTFKILLEGDNENDGLTQVLEAISYRRLGIREPSPEKTLNEETIETTKYISYSSPEKKKSVDPEITIDNERIEKND